MFFVLSLYGADCVVLAIVLGHIAAISYSEHESDRLSHVLDCVLLYRMLRAHHVQVYLIMNMPVLSALVFFFVIQTPDARRNVIP